MARDDKPRLTDGTPAESLQTFGTMPRTSLDVESALARAVGAAEDKAHATGSALWMDDAQALQCALAIVRAAQRSPITPEPGSLP
jgi:hypothetical protein